MDLESTLRDEARALGFSACGFAAAQPITRGAFLGGWLDAGFAGEMHYLERRPARRLTVATIVPDARSVISLAYPYAPPPGPELDWRKTLRGRVAAYALGADYHGVLERKLARLETLIARLAPGSRTRRYVDTGAVLEREWAVRGGLGWFGKNTMLLSTGGGSWFFLAELVTDLALTPDRVVEDHCGRCTRCLDACPTAALGDGLVLNAPRCIAYLTIEHRSAIPPALRAKLGPWVFGCDVCQETCPWNGKTQPRRPLDPATLDWLFPPLLPLLTLDDAGFRARFGKTPIGRTKRRGLLRNVAVALGNSGNPEAIPALRSALADPEPLVRGHAAWALGAIGGRAARAALERQVARESDTTVRAEITAALGAVM